MPSVPRTSLLFAAMASLALACRSPERAAPSATSRAAAASTPAPGALPSAEPRGGSAHADAAGAPARATLGTVLPGRYGALELRRLTNPPRLEGEFRDAMGESPSGSGPSCDTYFRFVVPTGDQAHVPLSASLDPKHPEDTRRGELWIVDERTVRIRLDEVYGVACAPPDLTHGGETFLRDPS